MLKTNRGRVGALALVALVTGVVMMSPALRGRRGVNGPSAAPPAGQGGGRPADGVSVASETGVGFGGRPARGLNFRGTVESVPPGGGALIVQGYGEKATVLVKDATRLFVKTQVTASALKPGDRVWITGFPDGIKASSLTAGPTPPFLAPRPFPVSPPIGQGAAAAAAERAFTVAIASASGKVKAVRPGSLTVALGGDAKATLTVRVEPDLRAAKVDVIDLSGVRVGDHVEARGSLDANNVVTAVDVTVDRTQPQ